MGCKRIYVFCCFLLISAFSTLSFGQINTTRHSIDNLLDGGFWIHTVDFDNDGDVDIVAASLRSDLKWYENDGTGNFTRRNITDDFEGAWSIHANDVDNDGDMDIVACSEELGEVTWWERLGDENFVKHVIEDGLEEPQSVYSADFDNDDDIDVVAATWRGRKIIWWENDGEQDFTKHVLDNDFAAAHSVYAADLDNDGDIDILGGGGGKTAWWRNDGNGGFNRNFFGSVGTFCVFAADIDGNGLLDVLRNQRDNGDIDWFKNTDGNNFVERNVASELGETWSIAAGDLDLDGDQDVVTAAFVPNKVSYWLNDGNENFDEVVLDDDLNRPRSVVVADFDNDGDEDIAAVTRADNLFWYEVLGSPSPPKTVTVIRPNGGETLETGSDFTIQWTSTENVNSVDIDYSMDAGGTWTAIVGDTPNTGSFSWTVPQIASENALIRISDSEDPTTTDISDNVFAIVSTTLSLNSPNGGESWFGGSTESIVWSSTGLIDAVNIEYSIDNGVNWLPIVSGTPNDGRHDWLVPDVQSDDVRVRISDAADGIPVDVSDAGFSILSISLTLTRPNGGETWIGGTQQTITWNSTGAINSVNLEYSVNNGANWLPIATEVANSGEFEWSVPDVQTSSARVRVSDAADGSPVDESNDTFSIIGSSLTITAPNGGETWFGGTSQTIAWNSVGQINGVTLEYSLNNGVDWNLIETGVPNSGNYNWPVPNLQSDATLIRISDASDGNPTDVSDGVFSIVTESLEVIAPNGGETWFGGNVETISWEVTGPVDSVAIEYSLDGGNAWLGIGVRAASDRRLDWHIPDVQSESALIRISDTEDGDPIDVSDTAFSIIESSLTLVSPNGGENLIGEQITTISWASTGRIDSVRLDYTPDNGVHWMTIVASTFNDGQHDWLVPNTNTEQARIRIFDAFDGTPDDVSDDAFKIIVPNLTVISPNGGESWQVGSRQLITWNSTGVIDSVSVEYSLDSGITWMLIAAQTPNDGSYEWTLPTTESDSVLVRIADASDGNPTDESDALFSIVPVPTDVAVERDSRQIPDRFELFQNYPNPFNLATRINFALHKRASVHLAIYNLNGKLVRTLFEDELLPGVYSAEWDGHDKAGNVVTSGVYIYKIRIGGWQASKKLLLVK